MKIILRMMKKKKINLQRKTLYANNKKNWKYKCKLTKKKINLQTKKSKTEKKPLSENNINCQRGKYLKPCPDIHLIYNRPLRK